MTTNQLFIHDDKEDCCKSYFGWKLNRCIGSSSSATGTGKYFPDWEGNNKGCLQDNASNRAPDYIFSSEHWVFDTIDECCEVHYSWMESECKGTSGTGSQKWYIDWNDKKCVKDCALTSGSDCGGYADHFGRANLHTSKADCCKAHMSWDYRHCFE